MSYHKLVEAKSKSDFSREEFSASPVNRIPLKRVRHHPSYIRWGLSSLVRFRLLEAKSGSLKLSKEQINGDILYLSEKGILISTKYHIPDEGFLLATLILNQTITVEGILGKIKKVEFQDNGEILVGVEFSSIEKLKEASSLGELKNLPIKPGSFTQKLHNTINRHLHKDEIVPHRIINGYSHATKKTDGDNLNDT